MDNPEPDTGSATDNVTEAITLVDNRSAPCAVGLIRAARAMEVLQPGDLLEVWSRRVCQTGCESGLGFGDL